MIKRNATAVWNGNGQDGAGYISTQSTVLDKTQYSFKSRFADGPGTNPEELLAAAHAGCFTMKLTFSLQEMGYTAEKLETKAIITLEDGIKESHLILVAKVPGISADAFNEAVKDAKENCPVSKALNVTITADAQLV